MAKKRVLRKIVIDKTLAQYESEAHSKNLQASCREHPSLPFELSDSENARNDLIEQVMTGLMPPNQANQLALDRVLEPLETEPETPPIDPDTVSYWTVPMTLAWIATKKLDHVARYTPEFRNLKMEWHPFPQRAFIDGQPRGKICFELRSAPTTSSSLIEEQPEWRSAFERLNVALGDGELQLIAADQPEPRIVSAPTFISHKITDNEGCQADVLSYQGAITHRELRISRLDLMRVFPDRNVGPNPIDKSNRGSGSRLILKIFSELYPSGHIPLGMTSKERNAKIQEEHKTRGCKVPHVRSIEKALKNK